MKTYTNEEIAGAFETFHNTDITEGKTSPEFKTFVDQVKHIEQFQQASISGAVAATLAVLDTDPSGGESAAERLANKLASLFGAAITAGVQIGLRLGTGDFTALKPGVPTPEVAAHCQA